MAGWALKRTRKILKMRNEMRKVSLPNILKRNILQLNTLRRCITVIILYTVSSKKTACLTIARLVINGLEILNSNTCSLIYPDNAVMSSWKCHARSAIVKWVESTLLESLFGFIIWIFNSDFDNIKGFVTLFSCDFLDSRDYLREKLTLSNCEKSNQ